MATESLSKRVLDVCEELHELLLQATSETPFMSMQTQRGMLTALVQLEAAARRRISLSESERTRRRDVSAGSVMLPGPRADG